MDAQGRQPDFTDDDGLAGCGLFAIAYLLGSYFVACVEWLGGTTHWLLLIAPVAIPLFCCLAAMLVGNSELPADPVAVTVAIAIWVMAIVASYGLLRSWRRNRGWGCPVAMLLGAMLLSVYYLQRG